MFNTQNFAYEAGFADQARPHPESWPTLSNDNRRAHPILLVEDTATDARLVEHALDTCGIPYELTTISRGEEVMPFLTQAQQFSMIPHLVMLDLGLPGANGFDVLDEMTGACSALRSMPITILTGLHNFEYIIDHYGEKLAITAYHEKPCDPIALRATLRKALQ